MKTKTKVIIGMTLMFFGCLAQDIIYRTTGEPAACGFAVITFGVVFIISAFIDVQ